MKIANRPISAAVHAAVLFALASPAAADNAACEAVLQAVIKQTTVPVHQKITIESAASPGKPLQSELIHLGDTLYMQIQGRWMTRPYDAAKVAEDARQAMVNAEHSCTLVRSEAIDGQAAELYGVTGKTPTGTSESQIWISRASGLPLRQQTTIQEQGKTRVQHEVRFDYADVKAPAGVTR
jgi:hypothetical protein